MHLMIQPKVGGDFCPVTSAAYLGHGVVIFSMTPMFDQRKADQSAATTDMGTC